MVYAVTSGTTFFIFQSRLHLYSNAHIFGIAASPGQRDVLQGVSHSAPFLSRLQALEASMPLGLLSLALEFVSTEVTASERSVGSALTGLPMVLLEDFLESQACLPPGDNAGGGFYHAPLGGVLSSCLHLLYDIEL